LLKHSLLRAAELLMPRMPLRTLLIFGIIAFVKSSPTPEETARALEEHNIELEESPASKLSSNLAKLLPPNLINIWQKNGEEEATARLGSFDVADFSSSIYDFFTGDQFAYNVVGYLSSHLVWQGIRGSDKVSSDPDLDTVWQLLTTTGSAPSNFGLTVAYAIAPTIVWGLLTGLASSRKRRSAGLEEIPAPRDLSSHFDPFYQNGNSAREIPEGQEVSSNPATPAFPQRRVYWAGEQAVGGKPEKKRAALAHFDTILGLDQVMVQLTIRAVLAGSFAGLWYLMSFLPDNKKRAAGKRSNFQEDDWKRGIPVKPYFAN